MFMQLRKLDLKNGLAVGQEFYLPISFQMIIAIIAIILSFHKMTFDEFSLILEAR